MFWRSHRNLLRRSLNFLQVPRLVIDHILVSGSHVGRLTVYYTTVLGKIYKKKKKLNLSLNRLFSEFDCIEEIIWGREHQWASVLQRCSLKQTRTELSVGAGPCLILSKSLRSSETPWSDVFRCLSESLPSLRPSPAARVGDEDARVEWAESTVTQTAPGFCSGTSKLMCYISLIPFGFWHGTDFV